MTLGLSLTTSCTPPIGDYHACMESDLSVDDCFVALHAAGWSVGSAAVEARGTLTWFVYGNKGDQKIIGRGLTELHAWRAALKSAAAVSDE